MKRKLIAAAALAALFSAAAWAQWGPGMMGGYGPGGYGMGPGMMGGYGMGPGMMGGYGPGYGMGPGMMGGYGPGMMWGYGPRGYGGLDLTDEQQAKIAEIQRDVARKHWDLMDKIHDQRFQLYDSQGRADDASARKAFEAMNAAHKAMFEFGLEARKRIDAVLTDEQRKQLRRDWRGR